MNCSDCKNNGTQICSVCCSYQGCPDRWEAKPKTNADRFRAMSDEELAKTISGDQIYPWCTEEEPCKYDSCTDCVLAWLKQEADT